MGIGDSSKFDCGKRNIFSIEHWNVIELYLIIYDAIAINIAWFLALFVRFEFSYTQIPEKYIETFIAFAPYYTVFSIIVFYIFKLYKSIWRFASFTELNLIIVSSIITILFKVLVVNIFICRMPASYYVLGSMFQVVLITGIRFLYRYITLERCKLERMKNKSCKNTMIIGAGQAGRMVIKELLLSEKTPTKIVCIVDDNPNKWNRYIDGLPIVGGRHTIVKNVKKYNVEQIFFAIPSVGVEDKKEILNICNETGCRLKSLPGTYQILNGEVSVSQFKNVEVEDLLGRDQINIGLEQTKRFIKDKTILVTGGGGSVGSELCRQISKHQPKLLIILDIYENNAYDIEQELKRKLPDINMKVLIGSVRDTKRIDDLFDEYRPDIVYHAAAHKHVPLMETSPNESIKNNVYGTFNVAYAALKYGVDRFVLISTDKAVNPTNIMGASKRMCEMIIQSMDYISQNKKIDLIRPLLRIMSHEEDLDTRIDSLKTRFVAVRFGNVLGSNGSVIPLFKKQISNGGPVTVTHPEITRFFMTIPEAVSLVLQAGVYAEGGEIFVLDMGESVKIDTLARNLIRLSGYKPDEDIKIEYTGLRPGEKLYEEKLMAEEGLKKTDNELIHIGMPIEFDREDFVKGLVDMYPRVNDNYGDIRDCVSEIVCTYGPEKLECFE